MKGLSFDTDPNYEYVRTQIKKMYRHSSIQNDGKFDWLGRVGRGIKSSVAGGSMILQQAEGKDGLSKKQTYDLKNIAARKAFQNAFTGVSLFLRIQVVIIPKYRKA